MLLPLGVGIFYVILGAQAPVTYFKILDKSMGRTMYYFKYFKLKLKIIQRI